MTSIILRTKITRSWFGKNGGPHHLSLRKDDVQNWMLDNKLSAVGSNACKVDVFADGKRLEDGKLNYDTGYVTTVEPIFRALRISRNDVGLSLLARLSCDAHKPEVHVFRYTQPTDSEVTDWERLPLHPFSAKSEDPYTVGLKASEAKRAKPHEQLLNHFEQFLRNLGYTALCSRSVDLALINPPLLVEAKHVKDNSAWTSNIRAAVAQLHEYEWYLFRGAKLLFLASRPVPTHWMTYLRERHEIRSAWPVGDSYYIEEMDVILPVAARQSLPEAQK